MRVVLLGTGSASGWPNPFCACASCAWARDAGVLRGQSAALVDDVLLLDCGPEVPRAAERLGHPLTRVRHLLLTHAHPDHLGGAALSWREWAGTSRPLDVYGPPAAISEARAWTTNPHVTFHEVAAGDALRVGPYDVRVVAANHPAAVGPPVLYDVADGTGRMFYGTDTGPLPASTITAVTGAAYDCVFLEETFGDGDGSPHGHLDLDTFPREVARLRECGAVTDATRVIAIHLGDDNPPGPELVRRLEVWGAEALDDGAVVDVGTSPAPPRPAAPRRVLVLGGARSGKSREAERRLLAEPHVTYVATARPRPDDEEWTRRVKAHQARRPERWTTLETTDIDTVLATAVGPLLVDCLTLWLGAVIDDADDGRDLDEAVDRLVDAWRTTPAYVVAVSNEVGSGVVPSTAAGRSFRDALGTLNARLAATADEVWVVTAGIGRRLR